MKTSSVLVFRHLGPGLCIYPCPFLHSDTCTVLAICRAGQIYRVGDEVRKCHPRLKNSKWHVTYKKSPDDIDQHHVSAHSTRWNLLNIFASARKHLRREMMPAKELKLAIHFEDHFQWVLSDNQHHPNQCTRQPRAPCSGGSRNFKTGGAVPAR